MVRSAKKDEIIFVNNIRQQVLQHHAEGRGDIFSNQFTDELKCCINKFIHNHNADILVCVRDNVVCGMAMIEFVIKPKTPYAKERKYLHIEEFGVDKQYRRQGVGTELFNYIKALSKEKGYNRIELDMWEFNTGALKFYEAQGFNTYRRYMEAEV